MNLIQHFEGARNITAVAGGAHLFKQGEPGDAMYVLLEGMADVIVQGTQVELATPGTILGEMALIDRSPRSASVACRTNCRLVAIDQAQFDLLVQETPAFARHVMAVMAERLRRMNERLKHAVREGSLRGQR